MGRDAPPIAGSRRPAALRFRRPQRCLGASVAGGPRNRKRPTGVIPVATGVRGFAGNATAINGIGTRDAAPVVPLIWPDALGHNSKTLAVCGVNDRVSEALKATLLIQSESFSALFVDVQKNGAADLLSGQIRYARRSLVNKMLDNCSPVP